jgi:hypothetical protein
VCYSPPADPAWRLCPFHWLTGLDCPLCGLTRALFALAKGRLRDALHFNALAPLAALMLAALLWRRAWVGRLWIAGLAAFLVYGFVRNWPA